MIVAPGCFSRNASASSAVTKSPEMNSPLPSMKKQRSASPSQAMPMSAFCRIDFLVMSRRFSSISGLASWFGNVPSISKQSLVVRAGQPLEELRRHQAGHAAAGVEHDVERLDDRRVDERHHLLDVVGEACRGCVTRASASRPAAAAGRSAIMSRMSPMPGVAAERQRLGAHHLDAVVLLRIVRRGDLRAALEAVVDDREVEHVGAEHAVVDDVGALLARAVDEGRGERRRRDAHVARHADPRRAQIRDEAAADLPRDVFVDLAGIEPADVVGLEDAGLICIESVRSLGMTLA